jgi:hypothetical protein
MKPSNSASSPQEDKPGMAPREPVGDDSDPQPVLAQAPIHLTLNGAGANLDNYVLTTADKVLNQAYGDHLLTMWLVPSSI